MEHVTYVPEFKQVEESPEHSAMREVFRTAFCSYPSFWLFESLCHSFAEDIEFSALEKALMEKISSPPFLSHAKDGPLYNVTLTTNDELNRMVASAFTYLGIPVYEWQLPALQPSEEHETFTIPTDERQIAQWINECYRKYLRDCLRVGERNESISRALRLNMGSRRAKASSIEVQSVADNMVTMVIELSGQDRQEQIKWDGVPTVDLAFSAFSTTNICKEHTRSASAASNTKTLELQIEALYADGSTKRYQLLKRTFIPYYHPSIAQCATAYKRSAGVSK